jgi:hypothetical protein
MWGLPVGERIRRYSNWFSKVLRMSQGYSYMGWKYIVTATKILYMKQGDHHGSDTME